MKGEILYPASYTAGFVFERFVSKEKSRVVIWQLIMYKANGADYRFYGQADPAVRDKWELRAGAQLTPVPKD